MKDWIQLAISAISLGYLVRYVFYTKQIALQSVNQIEATFKPAVIAIHGESTDKPPRLRNIGNGPAISVEWSIPETNRKGVIPYIEPGEVCSLPLDNMRPLREAALKAKAAVVSCSYQSLSGTRYHSENVYDFNHSRFNTVFGEAQKRRQAESGVPPESRT